MSLRNSWPLAIVMVLFVGLAAIGIGDDSLWLDESESWMWATVVPVGELVKATGQSNHAPTYYAALHGWIKLGNDSDAWIRALSLIFMTWSIPVVYLLGVVAASRRVGLIAAILFASSPLIYEFAQEARPYSLLTLSAGVVLLIFALGVKQYIIEGHPPTVIGVGWRSGRLKADLLWLGLLASLLIAITTHHTALALLPIVGGLWTALIAFNRRRRTHLINTAIFAATLCAIYGAFFLPGFMESWGNFRQGGVSLRHGVFMLFIIYGNGRIVAANFLFILPPLFALWKWHATRQWVWALFFLVCCLGLLAIVLFIGQVHGSVFKWRTFIWVAVPYCALIGFGLTSMRWWLTWTLLALIVAANIVGVVMVHQSAKQPWERIAQELHSRIQPGDAIVACPAYNHKSFYRYWQGPTTDLWGYNSRTNKTAYLMPNLSANLEERRRHPTGGTLTFAELVEHYPRVWALMSWHPECRELGEPVFDVSFNRYIWVTGRPSAFEGNLAIRKIE